MMDFKLVFILVLMSCAYMNAQVMSSITNSGQIRKVKVPCGCQGPPMEVPTCRCGIPITEPTYGCGCRAPTTCGCRKPAYLDSTLEASIYGFDLPASLFSIDLPYGCLAPDVCRCQKPAVKLSNSYDYFTETPICSCQRSCGCQAKPCGCQAKSCGCQANPCACQAKPCGCQMSAGTIPVNIFDFLTALDASYGSQGAIQLTYEYITPTVEFQSCGCRVPVPEIPKCGCQIPKIEGPRGANRNPIEISAYPYEYLTSVMDLPCRCSQMDVPNYSCQCQPKYYPIDMPNLGYQIPFEMSQLCGYQSCSCGCPSYPCGSQNSPCGCQTTSCGCQSSPCTCGCGCGCRKYLRQVTLQPPFL